MKKYNFAGLFLTFALFSTNQINAEFRFCQYGPHRIKNLDCPFGVFFRKPINTSCIYYANDQTGPYGEAELSVCKQSPRSLSAAGERVDTLEFQAIFIDVTDPSDRGDLGTLGEDCVEECMEQWVPLDERRDSTYGGAPTPEEPDYFDMMPNNLTEPLFSYHKNLTLQMFQLLTNEDDTYIPLAHLRSAHLLDTAFKIFQKFAKPFITEEFLKQIYRGFMFLVYRSKEPINDIGFWEKEAIDKVLKACTEAGSQTRMIGVNCDSFHKVTGYEISDGTSRFTENYVIESKSFRWGKYDPIVETAWAALDFVHAHCFPYHRTDLNTHHLLQLAVEGLFTKTILQRWEYPPKFKRGDSYWSNILQVPDAKQMMENVDAAVVAAYHSSAFNGSRLNRPFVRFPGIMSEGRSLPPAATDAETGQQVKKGWIGTQQEYWEWYKSNKVIHQFFRTHGGVCIKNPTQLANLKKSIEETCNGQAAGGTQSSQVFIS